MKTKFVIMFLVLVMSILACGSPSAGVDITYEVNGAGTSSVTYYNASGNMEQFSSVSIPWTNSFKGKTGTMLSLVAQQNGTGEISCVIRVNGEIVEQAHSSGAYVMVTCTHIVGL